MKIGLFIPCYVDTCFPEVGVATVKILRNLGVDFDCPSHQTCCGQPMANAGFESKSAVLAEKYERTFAGYDYVVQPSVSCAAFIRTNYKRLLGPTAGKPCRTAETTLDLVAFLHDILKVQKLPGAFPHKVSLHNSCHGVRELGLSAPSEQIRTPFNKIKDLLSLKEGITVVEPERADECCGFGGMFAVEETAVSLRMGRDKLSRHVATGATYVTGPDSACLMHLSGIARRDGVDIKFRHVAEILAEGL